MPKKPIKLTVDEVATAAQLAGVPPALALAIWQGKNKFDVKDSDPVENMNAGLSIISEGLRGAEDDWEDAVKYYYETTGSVSDAKVIDRANQLAYKNKSLKTEEYEAPVEDTDFGTETSIPGFSRMEPTSFNVDDENISSMGNMNYEIDRFIRTLVDQEFNNK